MHARLIDKEVVEEPDLISWAQWFETADRHVALYEHQGIKVSTVFLGMNHGFWGKPLWFETMILGGPLDGEMVRYSDYGEALAGHECMVERVKNCMH